MIERYLYGILATVVFSAITVDARAADAGGIPDIRCIVAGARLLQSADQKQQLSGQMILAYYLGRIDGRFQKINLEKLIKTEAAKMSVSDFKSTAAQCGTEFSARAKEVVRIGEDLKRLGM